MFIKSVKLVDTVYNPGKYPPPLKGEVAFVGRSNVGKSTLLNTLFGRKIAFVSKHPGKTRSINFYLVNSSFYMVDLPGYGYARVSKEEKKRWKELIEDYFRRRWSLKLVFLLIDGRIPPQETDEVMIAWMKDLDVPFVVVLTKIDKVKKSERAKMINVHRSVLKKYGDYTLISYSAITKEGVDKILEIIETIFRR